VIDGLVTRRVLVTELLEGAPVLEAGASLTPERRAGVAEALAAAYGHQAMIDGLFQADPHPGNILVLPDGRIGLLDFGLTKELPPETRLGFARLVVASAARDPGAILAAFEELGVKTRSRRLEDLVPLVGLFFDARPPGGSAFMSQQRQALVRAPIDAIPGDLVLLGRVVGLLRGVSRSLGTTLTPMEMLRPYAERALAEAAVGEAATAS
jgi:predicted unusual protein kinase regulating ubiquinone biosynthesis (AarF/ABC1/UbiB family)